MIWAAAAAIIAGAWLWRAAFRPFADCRWCDGTGKKRTGRRFRHCWACKGTGRRQVLGSRQVHRAARAITGARRGRKS
jgi:DnaJ-class molecular chaperone